LMDGETSVSLDFRFIRASRNSLPNFHFCQVLFFAELLVSRTLREWVNKIEFFQIFLV
jgi:hypothetical protein